jgi:nucleoside phosphorylase
METKEKIDVLIVTAAKGEDAAVRKIFGNNWITMNPNSQLNFYWDKITLTSKQDRRFTVGIVRSKMRTDNAGPIATIMIQNLRPSFVTMCGICAGHPKDTNLGDVIIADKVFRYDIAV